MGTLHFDQRLTDNERRQALYSGDIFVYSPVPASRKLCALARGMIEEAFAPHDPRRIDQILGMEEAAAVLAKLKPAFIHHPDCKRLLPEIIVELGADPAKTYFDVPRMRSAYPTHYLTSGIAYAFPPASGHLVFGPDVSDKLLAADFRHHSRELPRHSPELLR